MRTRDTTHQKVAICPTCGEVVDPKARFCAACQRRSSLARWRRVGLVQACATHVQAFFRCTLGMRSISARMESDIGLLISAFLSSIQYSMALTGLLFGGTAGSLFYLLYRRVPELRRLYEFQREESLCRPLRRLGAYLGSGEPYYEGEQAHHRHQALELFARGNCRCSACRHPAFCCQSPCSWHITDLGYELPSSL